MSFSLVNFFKEKFFNDNNSSQNPLNNTKSKSSIEEVKKEAEEEVKKETEENINSSSQPQTSISRNVPSLQMLQLINAQNDAGETTLHMAARRGDLEGISKLLHTGSDVSIKNRKGEMPFDVAIHCEKNEVITFILKGKETINVRNISPDNPEDAYSYCLHQAISKSLKDEEILYYVKLGDFYLQKRAFIIAAKCFNCALALTKDYLPNEFFQTYLFAKLEQIETLFLEDHGITKNNRIENPKDLQKNKISRYRAQLKTLRDTCNANFEKGEPASSVLSKLTQGFMEILKSLILDAQSSIGIPPCEWACMGLGSMARFEMCFFSDEEYAFVIKNPKDREYFHLLAQFVELKIINMGETKLSLFEGGLSPVPSGFSQDTAGNTPLGVKDLYELIGTPQKLAQFQTESWLNDNVIVVNALNTVSFVCGSEKLIAEYQKEKASMLNNKNQSFRKSLAEKLLNDDLHEFKPELDFSKENAAAFGIKKELYRPFQAIINSLAIWHNLPEGNTLSRIDALVKKKVFSLQGGENLKEAINFVFSLRLKAHFFYQTENDILGHPTKNKSAEKEIKPLYFDEESKSMIKQIYSTLLPFHRCATTFATNSTTFKDNIFLEEDMKTQGDTFYEKELYEEAYEAYQQAISLDPQDQTILNRLHTLEAALGIEQSLSHYMKSQQISLASFHSNPQNDLNAIFNLYLRNPEEIKGCHEVIKIRKVLYGDQHPLIADGYISLGYTLNKHGQDGEAIVAYKQALSISLKISYTSPNLKFKRERNHNHTSIKALIEEILGSMTKIFKDSKIEKEENLTQEYNYPQCRRILGGNNKVLNLFFSDINYDSEDSDDDQRNFEFDKVINMGSSSNATSTISSKEREYIQRLAVLDLDSILDSGSVEEKCKDIGQEIFDAYKADSQGKSLVLDKAAKQRISNAGKEAVQKICNAIRWNCSDGKLRQSHIERAWHGIGDEYWTWRA